MDRGHRPRGHKESDKTERFILSNPKRSVFFVQSFFFFFRSIFSESLTQGRVRAVGEALLEGLGALNPGAHDTAMTSCQEDCA